MAKFHKRGGKDSGRDSGRDRKRNRGGRDRSDSDSKGPRKQRDEQRGQGGKATLKVERRDQSKGIKKGPKKITTESLRREGGDKQQKKGKKPQNVSGGKGDGQRREKHLGRRDRKGGRSGKKGGNPKPKDPAARAEDLDKEMESYWVKGGHAEVAQQRLDDELEGYFAAKEKEAVEGQQAPEDAAPAVEEKKE